MKKIILLGVCLFAFGANAQSVAINADGSTADPSAILELKSNTQGFLPPRMTSIQRDAIVNPAQALVIYNIDANCIQVNLGTTTAPNWECISGASAAANASTSGTAIVAAYGGLGCAGTGTISGNMKQGDVVSNVTMTLYAYVTQIGSWSLSATENGVTFSGSGTFTATGCQSITLTATGTPTASGQFTWFTFSTPAVGATATVKIAGNPLTGGTAVVTTWVDGAGCSVGAGPNNSPAGKLQGAVRETMVQGVAAPASASVVLSNWTSTAGTYNVTTNSVNGITFAASGTFTSTGSNQITLTPTGTPIAAGNYKWTTTTTPSIDIYGSVITTAAPLGSTYTSHFNGIIGTAHVGTTWQLSTQTTGQTFNNNTTCQNKPISAQGCGGLTSVNAGGRAHNVVNINGQCWTSTNLISVPNVYNAYSTMDWSNNTDQGYWGYYHATIGNVIAENGGLGWSNVEFGVGEGRLYQWCAAMDATISERSRGICPEGWHIPSDCEWMYLEHGQGMSINSQNMNSETSYRASSADNQGTPGSKLRSAGTGATNASGFSGTFSGLRNNIGNFSSRSSIGYWWTSTSTNSTTFAPELASYRQLTGVLQRGVLRNNITRAVALSVRCLKD